MSINRAHTDRLVKSVIPTRGLHWHALRMDMFVCFTGDFFEVPSALEF